MSEHIVIDDNDRIYIINSGDWIQLPPDEPSMRFITEKIENNKVTMRIEAKLPRFYMKRVTINE